MPVVIERPNGQLAIKGVGKLVELRARRRKMDLLRRRLLSYFERCYERAFDEAAIEWEEQKAIHCPWHGEPC